MAYANFESIGYLATLKRQVNYTGYYWNQSLLTVETQTVE